LLAAVGRWAGRLPLVVPWLAAQQALGLTGPLLVRLMRLEEPRRALVPLLVRRRELLESLPWVLLLETAARILPVRLWAKRKGRSKATLKRQ
jgi:hypothetical protein